MWCVGLAFTAPWGGEMRGTDRGRLREVSDAFCFLVFHYTSLFSPNFLYFLVFPCILLRSTQVEHIQLCQSETFQIETSEIEESPISDHFSVFGQEFSEQNLEQKG